MKTAFFYNLFNQLIYIEILKETEIETMKNMIYKLLKVLYSLKQSLYLWYKRLSIFFFTKLDLIRIHTNHSIFILEIGIKDSILSIIIDDIKIIVSKRSEIIKKIKQKLIAAFFMVDMGPISFYLGLRVDQDQEYKTIKLS